MGKERVKIEKSKLETKKIDEMKELRIYWRKEGVMGEEGKHNIEN